MSKRTVRRTARFERELTEKVEKSVNIEGALGGLLFFLERRADLGNAVRGTNLLCFPVRPYDGPNFLVYYRYSETTVELLSIRVSKGEF